MKINETSEVDFTTLDDESRRKLHRALYRQECRAWLLWGALALWGITSHASASKEAFVWENELIGTFVVVYSCYLSFWVIYPTQKFLMHFRESGDSKRGYGIRILRRSEIESTFDDSWASVWDFVPPLVIPVLGFLILLVLRLVFAAK